MILLTNKDYFNFPKMVKQLYKITERGDSIPHFIPYLSKEEKGKRKHILRALESGQPDYIKNENFT